jgi:hypothetical protein
MKIVLLIVLTIIVGCAQRPTLEELEDKAITSGEWDAVERREEVTKESLESRAPGCPPKQNKHCVEEQSGIQCYCLPVPAERHVK